MNEILQQAALGLGAGAIVAVAGQGIVQIYRGSGVLNFAHGAFALASAQIFVWGWEDHGLPLAVGVLLAVGAGALMGLLTHLLVMRPLRRASQLVRIIATLGVMQVVQQGSQLIFGAENRFVDSFLPDGAVDVGDIRIPESALVLTAIAVALTLVLWATMTYTRFGLATRAVAEQDLASRSVGLSPGVIAAVNWTIGGALAGLVGVLIVPGGLTITSILLISVPAFAAAVLGGFRSYLFTTVGAIAIAVGQSIFTFEAVRSDWPPGLAPALPFLVVIVVLSIRSSALPARDEIAARLPEVARTAARPIALVAVAAGAALMLVSSVDFANAATTTTLTAIVGLSLVVVTGLSGQISLAQYAIAGIGALAAARVSDLLGWPFVVCLVVGVLAAAACGAVFALPSLRTRGPALAVVTIGLGLAVQQGILADVEITGGFNGATPVERPSLFGLDISAVSHPGRYAALVVVLFGVLAYAVATLRRSRIGRRLVAVRGNERAASALGVSVAGAKIYAFALAAAIAGVGGVLTAFRFDAVQYGQFTFFQSLQIFSFVVIGGLGFVLGPLIGALAVPSGVVQYMARDIGDLESWLLLGAGAILIVVLIFLPDGIMSSVARIASRVVRHGSGSEAPVDKSSAGVVPTRPAVLDIVDLRVVLGPVTALDTVSIRVEPGRIVGLIGANGAGKTTLIDTASGFNRPAGGSISLAGRDLTSMSPATRARRGVARCFQTIEVFEDLSVRENLLVASDDVRPLHWLTCLARQGRRDLDPHVVAITHRLGLSDTLDRLPDELSHGQRRMIGVARALAADPAVLMLDEPAAGLDEAETRRLGELLRDLAASGLGILLVEHDVGLVVDVSDEVVALDAGQTIYEGDAAGVLDDPAIRSAYLGDVTDTAAATRSSRSGADDGSAV